MFIREETVACRGGGGAGGNGGNARNLQESLRAPSVDAAMQAEDLFFLRWGGGMTISPCIFVSCLAAAVVAPARLPRFRPFQAAFEELAEVAATPQPPWSIENVLLLCG